MSWLYSQVLVEEYSEDIDLAGELSAPSSGKSTQLVFSSADKMTAFSRRSLSGMMFKRLTENHGEDVLTLFLEDFPVRTLVSREKGRASMERDQVCGDTWRESSVKYCLHTSSWKTALCLWEEDLAESSVTLPKWGMMRSGELWELTTPEHLTRGIESGYSLPTPVASRGGYNKSRPGDKPRPSLDTMEAKNLWPTPRASSAMAATLSQNLANRFHQYGNLEEAVSKTMFPTPVSTDATAGAILNEKTEIIQLKSGNLRKISNNGVSGSIGLARYAQIYPTPTVNDSKNSTLPPSQKERDSLAGALLRSGVKTGGQLNPVWVEWLMNWPIGWTDLKPINKNEYQYWKEASTAALCGGNLREMWFNREAGAPSQGQEPDEQCDREHRDTVFAMPPQGASDIEASEMCDLQQELSAEEEAQINALRIFNMQQGTRPTISRVAMGVEARVDRLKSLGNGQVPAVAAGAVNELTKETF